jgi:serine/threonine protein phosphatase PrpC
MTDSLRRFRRLFRVASSSLPAPMKAPLAVGARRFEWAALSDVGCRRTNNEDSWEACLLAHGQVKSIRHSPVEIGAQGLLLLVSDGMGGALAGEEASRFCVERLPKELATRVGGTATHGAQLREAILATHAALVARSGTNPNWRGMGATLSAVWILPQGDGVLGHVGDSRVYGRQAGALHQLTEDQSVGAGMVRRGELTAAAAARMKYRSLLEQVMGGDGAPIDPQITPVAIEHGAAVALCSDGLFGPLNEQTEPALRRACDQPALDQAAKELIAAANTAGGPDNITVVLARLLPVARA